MHSSNLWTLGRIYKMGKKATNQFKKIIRIFWLKMWHVLNVSEVHFSWTLICNISACTIVLLSLNWLCSASSQLQWKGMFSQNIGLLGVVRHAVNYDSQTYPKTSENVRQYIFTTFQVITFHDRAWIFLPTEVHMRPPHIPLNDG